ncbi:trypsin-like peptidase domain-containing protein [Spirulina sp. 06S082]|uniref:trypsin-like peptidase domain-containing protein n=1 Tax=Spirulina sp. 06S082 TaxID=3110248 RepID=UPI002B20BE2A|nr:trypsin-like peptidase domain-containing protein [Spirulina sp. 06S082]MEA5468289.1 trypsin-like peptidase domain-containing protein [Spirulina sp. 06S082]
MNPDIFILVVDDEEKDLVSFKQSLYELGNKFGHQIDIKSENNVLEALKVIRQHRVDAIFLDYYFEGGMNGDELLDFLPAHLDSLYIALVSGRNEEELDKIVTKRNANLDNKDFPFRYLSKPVYSLQLKDVYQDIVEFLSKRPLPNPLAYTSRVVDESENKLEKLTAMNIFLETTMKYLVGILASDGLYRNAQRLLPRRFNKRIEYSFGVCLEWLDELYQQAQHTNTGVNNFVPEILEFLSKPLSSQQTPLEFLKSFENICEHPLRRGFINDEAYYRNIIDELHQPLTQLRKRLNFLIRYSLVAVEEINVNESDSNSFKYRLRVLMGLESHPVARTFVSKMKLEKGNIYIKNKVFRKDSLDQFLLLNPFVSFQFCPSCGVRRIFMLDTIQEEKLYHRDYVNHTNESELNSQKIKAFFGLNFDTVDSEYSKKHRYYIDGQNDLDENSLVSYKTVENPFSPNYPNSSFEHEANPQNELMSSLAADEQLVNCSHSVARVSIPKIIDGKMQNSSTGTAWLITPQLALTCWHVIEARGRWDDPINNSDLQEQIKHGLLIFGNILPNQGVEYKIKKLEYYSCDLDYALLRLQDRESSLQQWRFLTLSEDEPVTIQTKLLVIQHPKGQLKQRSEGYFIKLGSDSNRILHNASTEQGTSGSPVLKVSNWQVVALHNGENDSEHLREATLICAILSDLKQNDKKLYSEIMECQNL